MKITIKTEDLPAKRSGTAVAAQQRHAGKMRDKRERRPHDAKRSWKREDWS